MSPKVLQFIGKGQITIPQEWRAVFGFECKTVKASLQGDKIIIEPLHLQEEQQWEVEHIELNALPAADKKLVKAGRAAYKKGQKKAFLTATEFFKAQ